MPQEPCDFLQRTEILIGAEQVSRLRGASVLVFGLGGVGSYCVEALARAGVGALTLVDGDTVNAANINRQLYALRSTLGMQKCDVAKARVLDINPEAQVTVYPEFYGPETADHIPFEKFDYVADAIDMVSAKLLIIERANRAGVPVISAMGAGNRLDPQQFAITDIYRTQNCPLARILRHELRKRQIAALKVVYSPELPCRANPDAAENPQRQIGSISFVPSAAGLVMASAIVRDLCQIGQGEEQ